MRVMVTGASGFAGRHLCRLAQESGAEVVGVGRRAPEPPAAEAIDRFVAADLSEPGAAATAVRHARPDRIFHLAAQAHVGASWSDPRGTIEANVNSTVNVLGAASREAPAARVLVVGSGEQYGPVAPERLPVTEEHPFRPQNPYAVSKCAADLAAGFFADAHGLHAVRVRAFNHSGPGQDARYVVSSFASQIATAEADGRSSVTVRTGDVRPRRDFTHVADIARAYWMALDLAAPGAYNVCTGRSMSVADILGGLAGLTPLTVEQETDPALLREGEVMDIRGSHDRLTEATGWRPELPFERALADTLGYWRERVDAERAR